MANTWTETLRYYDLIHNNSDRYERTIELHVQELQECHKILDTGAGTGNLTLELLKQGHEVVAIDNDKFALTLLRKKCKKHKGLVTSLGVFCSDNFQIIENPKKQGRYFTEPIDEALKRI